MVFFSSSLGIDFRRNHLILTLLQKSFRKMRLIDYRIYPIWSEGQREVQEGQWISLISTFISKHQIHKDRVCVSIPREKVVVRFLRFPLATKENLRKVLEYEAPKYTPFDKEKIYLDYQILKEEKEWIYLIAIFVRQEEIDAYLSLLKKMGIQPLTMQIPAIAALNLFFYHEGEKANSLSVLLDVSQPFFEMNFVQGKDWKESFHLPLPLENKEERIIQTFKRSGFNGESLPKSAFYIYGLDAAEKALPIFSETDPIPEVAPPPMQRIDVGEDETRPDYIYASIGVALAGLIRTRMGLNILPLAMRKKVRQISKPLFMIFVALVLILGISWSAGIYSRYRNELEAIRAEIKKKKPEVEAVEKLQRQRGELTKEISELTKITTGEVSKLEILKELTQILPDTVWIWNFKYTGKEIEVSGFADSASDLIPLLDKSPLFEKVEFLAPVTKERERRAGGDKERERFKIKMRLEGRRVAS